MRASSSQAITLNSQTTVGQLASWMATLPQEAKISVHVSKGDRPFDSDITTMTASWSKEVML